MRAHLVLAAVLAALAGGALASGCNERRRQPALVHCPDGLPFETITATAGPGANGDLVTQTIQDASSYAAYFGGSPPQAPAVDFARETVLVVEWYAFSPNHDLQIACVAPVASASNGLRVEYRQVVVRSGSVAAVTVPDRHVVKVAGRPTSVDFISLN